MGVDATVGGPTSIVVSPRTRSNRTSRVGLPAVAPNRMLSRPVAVGPFAVWSPESSIRTPAALYSRIRISVADPGRYR
jgi:hypothetical protein